MTHRDWTRVVDDPAARHLVAIRLEPKAADEPAALVTALIEGLAPIGDYALVTRCEQEGAVMLCAFSNPADAEALAAAVDADPTDDYPEWASRHRFILDRIAAQAIADAIEASGMPSPMAPRAEMAPAVSAHA